MCHREREREKCGVERERVGAVRRERLRVER